jgi:hypothetical protein
MEEVSPERKAEINAILDEIIGPMPRPKPKVVTRNDLGTVRDADVEVSRADVNTSGVERTVEVRRPDYVRINMPLAIAQWEANLAAKQRDRERMKEIDPFGWGHWGSQDEDE